MNEKLFLEAMEGISEEYIVRAGERLAYIAPREKGRVRSVKRVFTVALAAVLVAVCTMAAAMAVSPELREMIISLFQIGETEQVPGIPAGVNEVRQVTIGGQVSAQYVKLEGAWYADDGQALLLRWDAEPESVLDRQPEHFYDLVDGELVEVGADAPETAAHLSWLGWDIDLRFRSFPYNGRLYFYDQAFTCFGDPDLPSGTVYAERLGSRTDVAVLQGECYRPVDTSRAWICDLKTGEVWDVLADCGFAEDCFLAPVLFAEDLKHALVRAWDGESGSGLTPYLVDLEEKTYTPLSELMGLDIETAFGRYEVSFYDSDTVMLSMPSLYQPEPISVWTYHIPSGMTAPTVQGETDLQRIWSGEAYHWALAQQVDEDGCVTILDLHTGGRVKLEGITVAQGQRCYLKANPSQTKLLWAEWGDSGVSRLGVVDLKNGVFTAFARENLDIQYNDVSFWMGDDRVAVMMNLRTGMDYVEPGKEYLYDKIPPAYYLCVYEF